MNTGLGMSPSSHLLQIAGQDVVHPSRQTKDYERPIDDIPL
jgi:hypothetical protein